MVDGVCLGGQRYLIVLLYLTVFLHRHHEGGNALKGSTYYKITLKIIVGIHVLFQAKEQKNFTLNGITEKNDSTAQPNLYRAT